MAFETVLFETADGVATITLNRPDVLNAFNDTMAHEFRAIWERVRTDEDIRAVVIRAAGDRAFCTGIDRETAAWWDSNIWNQEDPGEWFGAKANRVWKPVIAAVHGMCAGGAQYFINEADIIICSDEATFFDPHQNIGLVSALEPIGMLARGVPLGDVLRWALLGTEERITASTALRLGLVTEVVPRAQLWDRADALAKRIAARRPEAVQGTVKAIWEALDVPRSVALARGMSYPLLGNPPEGFAPTGNDKPEFR
ncbi:MAG: enoyl-CoA hydratase/isomerase family protein [Actinomycetota bacterium]